MNNKKNMKGAVLGDVIIAVLILMALLGVVSGLFIKIAYDNAAMQLNAVAVYYAIKTAEYIDKIPYDDVNSELTGIIASRLKEEYSNEEIWTNKFNINIDVKNYSDDGNDLVDIEDIIKIVRIKVSYSILEDQKEYEITKIKVKEM